MLNSLGAGTVDSKRQGSMASWSNGRPQDTLLFFSCLQTLPRRRNSQRSEAKPAGSSPSLVRVYSPGSLSF